MHTTLSRLAFAQRFALLAVVSICASLLPSAFAAASVALAWNPNPESESIAGYRIHYGTTSRNYSGVVEVGRQTTTTISNLPSGSYFAAVTAMNIFGIESELSDEVAFSITPGTRIFGGLIEPNTETGLKGSAVLTVTPTGVVTGRITVGAASMAVRSMFDANGRLSLIIRRPAPARNLTLALYLDPNGALTGTIDDGMTTSRINGEATTFIARTREASQKGRYTVALQPDGSPTAASQGLGFATLTVSNLGVARLSGTVSDGSRFSYSARLSDQGTLPVFIPLYNKLGSLFGTASFRDVPNVSDADGSIRWFKPGVAQPVATLGLLAARYAYTRNVPVLSGFASSGGNARVSFRNGGLAPDITDRPVRVSATNAVTVLPPNLERTTLVIVPSSGTFTGQFYTSPTASRAVRGVLIQKGEGAGFGWFSSASQSGRVELTPGQ
jgi:hypothetical protein